MACTIIIAAAGAGKTERLITEATAHTEQRVLITTYTNRNAEEIKNRITKKYGVIPANLRVDTWFSFLLRDAIKPYQAVFTKPFRTRSINFEAERPKYAKRGDDPYYYDRGSNLYKDTVADLACYINQRSGGKTIRRLRELYDAVLIDEMQDLVAYDLEFLDLLIESNVTLIMVGDPRQATYATSDSTKHKQYRGFGLYDWIEERRKKQLANVEQMNWSHRCNDQICRFADSIFPDQPHTSSRNTAATEHDGIFLVNQEFVDAYTMRFAPVILRRNRSTTIPAHLLPHAFNIGEVKGCTFDRVLIYPTQPMLKYLRTNNLDDAGDRERFYVAVTRARHSVAFVLQREQLSDRATAWTP